MFHAKTYMQKLNEIIKMLPPFQSRNIYCSIGRIHEEDLCSWEEYLCFSGPRASVSSGTPNLEKA